MSHSSGGHTSVRLPCWMFTIPSIASACTVSRATVRLTPYSVTISSDEGNASPDADPAGDDLGGEECRELLAQALRLAQALAAPRTAVS